MTLDELAVLFALSAGRKLKRTDDASLESLARDGLVTILGREASVSERGAAFVEYIQALPLPVGGWSMIGPGMPTRPTWYNSGSSPNGAAPSMPLVAVEDDGPAPPAPPLKVTRHIADPELRQQEAIALMNRGYGLREIKEELGLSDEDMTAYFGRWA